MSGGARINVNNSVCLYRSDVSTYGSVTIGGDFTGIDTVAKIDLLDLYWYTSNWIGGKVLELANGYSSGNLAVLKNRFILGNFNSTPITGCAIADDGTLMQVASIGITDISYSAVSGSGAWTLLGDGRRQSPTIGHNGITKSRVSFTSTQANASIMIRLDVSSEPGYDYAFVSTLDNASATFNGGYASRTSDTTSVTVSIPVPTAGDHFVDVGYQKDHTQIRGSDCAWYRVVLE
jgi:hypothetical protein